MARQITIRGVPADMLDQLAARAEFCAGRGPEETIVVDASVGHRLGGCGTGGESAVSAETLAAPELGLVEATNILRRLERRGYI